MDGIIDSGNMSLSKPRETVKDREAWHAVVHEIEESDTTERLNKNNNSLHLVSERKIEHILKGEGLMIAIQQ